MKLRVVAGMAAMATAFGIGAVTPAAQQEPRRAAGTAVPGLTSHFTLTTVGGRDVTEASFPGKWLVIYFGYTMCPDACPTTLNAIAAALAELGPLAAKIQPLFITVDPGRDTPEALADYVKAFDPRIVGLSGTEAQIAAAATAFRVYHQVRKLGNGEYAIDHSSFIYLVNPGGQIAELLTGNLPARPMAATLRNLIK
jgi:protein SCO1